VKHVLCPGSSHTCATLRMCCHERNAELVEVWQQHSMGDHHSKFLGMSVFIDLTQRLSIRWTSDSSNCSMSLGAHPFIHALALLVCDCRGKQQQQQWERGCHHTWG
jgi:hypothetical protein